ncbi:MAG: translocation/assembly module TamB domain-containing protein [Gemmatimonadales bacterium]|jgi:translocation and assembly module TamB
MGKRTLRRILLALAALLVLATTAIWALSSTRLGARLAIGQLERRVPGLAVGRVSGSLRGPLELHGIELESGRASIAIDHLLVDVRLAELLARRLTVDSLQVGGVRVTLRAGREEEEPAARKEPGGSRRFELPIAISLVTAEIDEISVAAPGDVMVEGGHLWLSGRPDAYSLRGGARVSTRLVAAELDWTGDGDVGRLDLDIRGDELLGGRARARARLAWTPAPSWEVSVDGEDLRPGLLSAVPDQWPGSVSLRGRSSGRLVEAGAEVSVAIDTLTGELRGQPLAARLRAGVDGDRYWLRGLSLLWGTVYAEASGEAGDSLDVELQVEADDLAAVAPGASGSLRLMGHVRGPRARPEIVARGSARSLRVGRYSVATLEGDVDVDLRDLSHARVDLTGRRIDLGGPVVNRIELEGRGSRVAESGRINIETLTADLTRGSVSASGWFGLRPVPTWDMNVRVTDLEPAGVLPAAAAWPGRLSLRGRTDGRLSDAGPEVSVTVDELAGTIRGQRLAGRAVTAVEGSEYSISTLDLRWGAARLEAAGRVGREMDLTFALDVPDLAALLPDAAGAVNGGGSIRGTRALPQVRGSVEALALRYRGYAVDELRGRVNLGFAGERPAIELEAWRVTAYGQTIDSLSAVGRGIRSTGKLSGLALERLDARLLDGRVRAEGEFVWEDGAEWRLDVEGAELAPASLFPDPSRWPGRVTLWARLAGGRADSGLALEARVDTLYGTLRGQPLAARAAVALDSAGYSVPQLDVRWGPTAVHAAGRLAEPYDFAFEARTPDLGGVLPDASGSVDLAGRLTGTTAVPVLQARLDVRDVEVWPYRVGELTGDIDIDLRSRGRVDLSLRGRRVELAERIIRELTLEGSGERGAHRISARTDAGDETLTLEANGAFGEDGWRGTISRFDLTSRLGGAWELESAAGLTIARGAVELEPLCLTSDGSSFCAQGAWRGEGGWELASTLRHVPLAPLAAMLPPDWAVAGPLSGTIEAAVGADRRLFGAVDLSPGPGTFTYRGATEAQTVRYRTGTLRLDADARGIRGNMELDLVAEGGPSFGSLSATVELPAYTSLNQPLRDQLVVGQLQARLETLDVLAALLTQLSETEGRLEADVTVDGTVAAPRMLGELRLSEGRAYVPGLGLRIRDVQFRAAGDARGTVRLDGHARSGPGGLTIEGESPVVPSLESPARLRLTGADFQVSNTPAAEVLVSPNLEILVSGDRIDIEGDVRIPRTSIALSEIPRSAVPVSGDVIYVDSEAELRRRRPITARVRLILGDDVRFSGFGLSTGLQGSIRVTEEPDRPTVGSGELVIVDGRYKAYGQSLTIERGRLLFGGGPIDNPGLDVRASRVASDSVIAGLIITGTLRSPTVTLFSEPPMPESEALSYLVLGRPLTETSTSDVNQLTNAARSLGLSGGNLLARKIAARFGLAEARIEGGRSLQDASFVAGKYLSPRLYVKYGIGLFDHVSTFGVRYMLSSKWTLLGETGEGTSTDVLYRIERGR